jgi:hypothetical protein
MRQHDLRRALDELAARGILDICRVEPSGISVRIDDEVICLDEGAAGRFLAAAMLWSHVAECLAPPAAKAA